MSISWTIFVACIAIVGMDYFLREVNGVTFVRCLWFSGGILYASFLRGVE